MRTNWLLYGANGFTGEMIARRAVARGMRPILGGRNEGSIRRLAEELGLPWRVFDLSTPQTIRQHLQDCALVLHCAGPFLHTCQPMAEAAIASGCHYLDIAGEIDVFRYLHSLDTVAKSANVILLPGVGFDVVPTDCLAAALKDRLPDATRLELAFVGPNKAASGSIKTALHQLPYGSRVRRKGEIITIPHFSLSRTITLEGVDTQVFSIPWGDVYTAHVSTGIADIAVYTGFPRSQELALRWTQPIARLLKYPSVMRVAEWIVERVVPEPDDAYFASAHCWIWGEVTNATGQRVSALIQTPDTYTLTLATSLLCVQKVLDSTGGAGFQTPSRLFGSDALFEIESVRKLEYFGREKNPRKEP